jgi:hypothetical protein
LRLIMLTLIVSLFLTSPGGRYALSRDEWESHEQEGRLPIEKNQGDPSGCN